MKEKEMEQIARWITEVLSQIQPATAAAKLPVDTSAAGMAMVSEGGPARAPEAASAAPKTTAPAREKAPVQPSETERRVRAEVAKFAARFPLYARRLAAADAADTQPASTSA
jgi:glycine/serine hydroxymethyltransferase